MGEEEYEDNLEIYSEYLVSESEFEGGLHLEYAPQGALQSTQKQAAQKIIMDMRGDVFLVTSGKRGTSSICMPTLASSSLLEESTCIVNINITVFSSGLEYLKESRQWLEQSGKVRKSLHLQFSL